ncbi:MAG: DegV family EDD domain-containing protein [Lachnospiraceae bacterium]|nr:DegV family EDD domain-containing protein [Lachnospiraceae bacterium]
MKKIINDFIFAVRDPERDFIEKVFLIYTFVSEIAIFMAFLFNIIFWDNKYKMMTIVLALVGSPVLTVYGLYKNRIRIVSMIIVNTMVFVIIPALFFLGGGVEGGGVLWAIFAFMYVGLVLNGKWRKVYITILVMICGGCFCFEYYYPELIFQHNREMFYIDALFSLILIGLACFVMVWIQNRLLNAENERAKKETERAEELTRSQNRFFSSMSHEIRTPINSILGLNELILRDQSASDEILTDATGIQGAGKMLLALINDILDFSKIEAGSMDIVPVDYNVGDLMSEVVNMIWLRAKDKGLNFNVSIDPDVPSVLYGDEVRIKQIIINLLNNAVKYTQEGTVELHMESEDAGEGTVMLRITISDTGMGIKKEALPYLFDAFKRVDEEKNRHIEGTGLGLSIVKQIVGLMGGNISVNSIYGEGSMFTVDLKQGITDHTKIGDLNIHSHKNIKRDNYESSFKAPEARILIVDDNEMNLEVESKLLADTEMVIDKALSGRAALDMTLVNHYDAILMDHLMPEMDGIECLSCIRNQSGGLNRTTPIVVLTANAGSANRDLYNRAGFDGYLVKPVSGETLEELLLRYIPNEKLVIKENRMHETNQGISTAQGYRGKVPVIITASSVCDLPESITRNINIPILPFVIQTEEGVFKDGLQIGADELIRYINSGREAVSSAPDESAYADFFAHALKRAHHLIHIALTNSMSKDYERASEAAKSFDNVTVINSGCVSSAAGILVLIAQKLVQQSIPVEDIVAELEEVKHRLKCSFVVDKTDFMAKKGHISPSVHRLARDLTLHPCLTFNENRSGIGAVWMGNRKHAYKKYIAKAFPVDIIPDSDVVFITYVDVPTETLMWIKEEISKIAYFEHVVFEQASAGISSNCGPGTFGILYLVKGNKSYNIGSYVNDMEIVDEEEENHYNHYYDERNNEKVLSSSGVANGKESAGEIKWYEKIEGIDPAVAIKNSGSEQALRSVLEIFLSSIYTKSSELNTFYSNEDWENYTIKVHALKSSARIIGAVELGQMAQKLEDAGKEGNSKFIKDNHLSFMLDYQQYKDFISKGLNDKEDEEEPKDEGKPVADEALMSEVYEGLREAAKDMDCDTIEQIIKELEDYLVPDIEKEKYERLCALAGNFDYEGMLKELGE